MNSAGTARNMTMFVGVTFWVKGDTNFYSVKLKPIAAINTGSNDYKYTFKPSSSTTWEQKIIPFSIFTQESGWGTTVPLNTVLTNMKELQFESKG